MEKYPTEQEMTYVKRHTLIPIILKIFRRDREIIKAHAKIPNPHLKVIDQAIQKAEKEAVRIRAHFRKYGVKIYDEKRDDKGVRVYYKCRGYHTEASYLWPFMKAEAEILMSEYLKSSEFEQSKEVYYNKVEE